jgi:hypothetical protein
LSAVIAALVLYTFLSNVPSVRAAAARLRARVWPRAAVAGDGIADSDGKRRPRLGVA